MENQQPRTKVTEAPAYKDRPWFARFWDGMGLTTWLRLAAQNRFAVSPSRVPMALVVTAVAVFNSTLGALQALFYGGRIRRTVIEEAPIFIIGHWRSGTTLLHETLVRDPRHACPDTLACFAPNHFILSGPMLRTCFRWLVPSRRPMDNMAAGWERPQEDEFALCNMGLPSPYLTIAFPNRPQCEEYLDFASVPPEEVSRWKRGLLWFLRCVTFRHGKRIVLKSPPHTARIATLLEMFPDARFVHIVRDPFVLFPSTVNLWKRLYRDHGLQVPRHEGLEEYVLRTFTRMYAAFESQRDLIPPGRFAEVRYEDFVADPMREMERIYQELELDDFAQARQGIEEHLANVKGYKTNRYEVTPEVEREIAHRWSGYIRQYGYSSEPAGTR